ncbi:hypothetical protein ACJIZ3_010267 [Penstemon smallii]|uniref:Transposase, Ptta/En/Spm, plant n=1 Tax=Penstemon smallii TaxID=265156 RepID=A0ABD3TFY9_9LAMI
MNRRNGYKYPVHISSEKRRPLNRGQSAKLSNTLGIIAREHIPMPTRWTKLGEDDLLPAFDYLSLKLDIVGLDREKKDMVLDLLKNRTRNQRYKLHQHFLKHPTKEEALLDVPSELNEENWESLCAYWSDPKVQEICEVNKRNRNKLSILHNQGSRAFVTLLDELEEKEGRQLNKVEFFPPTHCTNGKWTTPDCEVKYNAMQDLQAKSIEEGSSMTPNECYDKIMGVKSGYDKGFGYGPKPPSKASSTSTRKLEIENAQLKERLGETESEVADLKARMENQEKLLNMLLAQQNMQPPNI